MENSQKKTSSRLSKIRNQNGVCGLPVPTKRSQPAMQGVSIIEKVRIARYVVSMLTNGLTKRGQGGWMTHLPSVLVADRTESSMRFGNLPLLLPRLVEAFSRSAVCIFHLPKHSFNRCFALLLFAVLFAWNLLFSECFDLS
jgi:hypothetical protein